MPCSPGTKRVGPRRTDGSEDREISIRAATIDNAIDQMMNDRAIGCFGPSKGELSKRNILRGKREGDHILNDFGFPILNFPSIPSITRDGTAPL
jgi:hypothetical protein